MIYNSALLLAEWQSGHAADCKSVHAGSIPTSASTKDENFSSCYWFIISSACPGGGIGRHKGLKIPRRRLRAGSSPALGTKIICYERAK